MARIEANQRDFRQILDELVLNQRSGATPHVEVDYSSLPKFPIESEADLTAFDVQLSIDTERKVFVRFYDLIYHHAISIHMCNRPID